MEKNTDIILTDFDTGIISLSKNSELDNIFNFSYNFDLLKEVLSTVIKNQISLKNQLDEKYEQQSQISKSLKDEIEEIKQSQSIKKGTFTIKQGDFDRLNNRINSFQKQISHINEELDKSKL